MSGCGLIGFDLLACGQSAFWAGLWWVADLLPWWGWLAAIAVAGWLVWRLAGLPGILAFAAGIGFLFGRRSARQRPVESDEIWPHPDGRQQRTRRREPLTRPPGEQVSDWFKRVTGRGEDG